MDTRARHTSMRAARRAAVVLLGLVLGLTLSGCASTRLIDSEVRSFVPQAQTATQPQAPAPINGTFRLERLPSQEQAHGVQDRLEAAVMQALVAKGLKPFTQPAVNQPSATAQTQADYAVQTQYRVYAYPYYPYGMRPMLRPMFWHRSTVGGPPPNWYKIRVDIQLRHLARDQIVYETHAVHDGPWADIGNLISPVAQAALQDFPLAQPQPRTVVIELDDQGHTTAHP